MKKPFSVYVAAYVVLLMVLLGMQYVYPKLEMHLLMNSYHNAILDIFFKYYSVLAEAPLYVLALLPLLWKKYRLTLFFAMCELLAGGVLQILKHVICMERPVCAFERCRELVLPLVEGVDMHHGNSFPSGHASTFFVFFTCCALLLAYHYQQRGSRNSCRTLLLTDLAMVVFLVLAALGAYSRVYLSQHFLSDVCMGSFIGFLTPCLMFYFLKDNWLKLNNEKLSDHDQETVS